MPCLIFQNETPSGSASTPSVAICGGLGVRPFATGEADASPFAVPWQIAQCCPYKLMPAIKLSSVISTGFGVFGASLRRVAARDVCAAQISNCLLYTSDAADDLLCVDLGGRRIIKKK